MSHHVIPLRIYFLIFGALMGLTVITVWVAFLDFGGLNDVIALSIAVTKAVLVILYFMHVRYSSRLTWVFVSAGFFWLLIMFVLTLNDYVGRSWEATPQGWESSANLEFQP